LVGFTATKKIGNAVVRNRAKRVLRSLFVSNYKDISNGTYIFLAKHSIVSAKYDRLLEDYIYALKKIGAYEDV
jgi:ribonuclease P protein component